MGVDGMIVHSDWLADFLIKQFTDASFEDVVVWPTIWAVDYNLGSTWYWTQEEQSE